MASFQNITEIGKLTISKYRQLVKKYDADKNGKLDDDEIQVMLSKVKLDEVTFLSMDTDGDDTISEEEFETFEVKIQKQKEVNNVLKQAAKDSKINKYIGEIRSELNSFLCDSVESDPEMTLEEFKEELTKKYEEIRKNIIKE